MARFAAGVFTITETTDWDAADYFRFNNFRDQVGQNIEWFAQTHAHDGTANGGASIPGSDLKAVMYYGPANPSWG